MTEPLTEEAIAALYQAVCPNYDALTFHRIVRCTEIAHGIGGAPSPAPIEPAQAEPRGWDAYAQEAKDNVAQSVRLAAPQAEPSPQDVSAVRTQISPSQSATAAFNRILALRPAPVAEPAQQDTKGRPHDWRPGTGGCFCFYCGKPWWTSQPEPTGRCPETTNYAIHQSGQGTKAPTAWEVIDTANKRGAPVWLFDSSLIEADFNPTGTVDGHWQDDVGWMGAVWVGYRDEWTTKVVNPTHWMARTMPGSDCKAPTKAPTDGAVAQKEVVTGTSLKALVSAYGDACFWKGVEDDAPHLEKVLALQKQVVESIDTLAARSGEGAVPGLIEWVVERWYAEVSNRPLQNKNRRPLDDAWRQMLRHLGVNDRERLGPTHDEQLAAAPSTESEKP